MAGAEWALEQVAAFLSGRYGTDVQGLERLGGGGWSSAWAYRAGGEELVVRLGRERSWFEADRMAMAFARPHLPVPEVREVGSTPDGLAYAISVRHRGRFLEDTPVELAAALTPTLTGLLVALRAVPAAPDSPVEWHQPGGSLPSWREFLLAGLVDDPSKLVHGWRQPWPLTPSWPRSQGPSPTGCGRSWTPAPSAATSSTETCSTATCWSARRPTGSRRCSPGNARCGATFSSTPHGAASGPLARGRRRRRPSRRVARRSSFVG